MLLLYFQIHNHCRSDVPFPPESTPYHVTELFLDFPIFTHIRLDIYKEKLEMTVEVSCDHAGLELKKEILSILRELNIEFIDHGTYNQKSVGYPDFGEKVSQTVSKRKTERGYSFVI